MLSRDLNDPSANVQGRSQGGPEQPTGRIGLANVEDIVGEIASILYSYYRDEILSILSQEDATKHYSVEMDMKDLGEINQQITMYTCEFPTLVLPLYDTALQHAQKHALATTPLAGHLKFKPRVHVRIFIGPPFAPNETNIHRVPRSDEVGKWRVLKGTVVRTGAVRMLESAKVFQCTKCGARWEVPSDREQFNLVPKPRRCAFDDGNMLQGCAGAKIIEVDVGKGARPDVCKDYQEIKVQEPVEKVGLGTIPRSIVVILEDDLVDQCKPGDDIFVTGTVIRRYKPFKVDERCDIEIALVANHVRAVNEQRPANTTSDDELRREFESFWERWRKEGEVLRGRDLLLKSFCPKIFGMYIVKLAIMLVLIGGVEMHQSGMKIRGDCHILLVGDPGTGKSQFLRYASRVSPRSVLTTGIGSTNAGLTCAAVKDSGEWQLEAGALVLADRGLCCIDEFGSIREHDKTAIHEAMEQQTISVAKAGLVCKLNTRCSILAATNPKGKYDPTRDVEINIALASPLLSRFDLVLILLDRENEDWDRSVSTFILDMESQLPETTLVASSDEEKAELWPLEKIQAYIAYVKEHQSPRLTEGANDVLKRYYQAQRKTDLRNAARTTIRLLESLIRLSQAHARLLNQAEVMVRDAVVAVMLMEASLQSTAIGGVEGMKNALHDGFAEDPDTEYLKHETLILRKLGLEHLQTHEEGGSPAKAQNERSGDQSGEESSDHEDDSEEEHPLCSWEPTPARSVTKRRLDIAEPENEKRSKVRDHTESEADGEDVMSHQGSQARSSKSTGHASLRRTINPKSQIGPSQEKVLPIANSGVSPPHVLLSSPANATDDESTEPDVMAELGLLGNSLPNIDQNVSLFNSLGMSQIDRRSDFG
ncbi:uncharacterized protein SPPG_08879 [Spizellomyces punctatus DAOM BR117]|uniref:DNA helicase n=1 Tax=Spizellomyces punctatus (strain DAOM BR117) TaxID=645134 RepID=A0A0L0HW85_SPIPD|nr:uncharacterized protein SPPG_08879 [Spizellomyces punctatus DAOM BR117]KND05144.1 hypothetical protein SPPG_08879 [Spizellomyces punctatus DAOM BR117]|eukprot:XP_016613183.1 hypothetical protein SPPG_08879 [Spizellomyces punctatus DAOM BR117]